MLKETLKEANAATRTVLDDAARKFLVIEGYAPDRPSPEEWRDRFLQHMGNLYGRDAAYAIARPGDNKDMFRAEVVLPDKTKLEVIQRGNMILFLGDPAWNQKDDGGEYHKTVNNEVVSEGVKNPLPAGKVGYIEAFVRNVVDFKTNAQGDVALKGAWKFPNLSGLRPEDKRAPRSISGKRTAFGSYMTRAALDQYAKNMWLLKERGKYQLQQQQQVIRSKNRVE